MTEIIRVAVSGAVGRMGREVVMAVLGAADMQMVAAVDPARRGADIGEVCGGQPIGVPIEAELGAALARTAPHVLVDFTLPSTAARNAVEALHCGVSPVVGTTGMGEAETAEIAAASETAGIPVLIAPNFAIGAVLMMEFAARAAAYMPDVEIIELHHDRKLDAPSGTAMMTARRIAAARVLSPTDPPAGAHEKAVGARGGTVDGIHIHSVRLPGYVAHQEVLFGGMGQTLTLRHDSIDRRSFMPGVLLAIRRVRGLTGLVVGLEHLL